MKLKLVVQNGKRILCCPNGSKLNADDAVIQRLLSDFKKPTKFKGTDGCWNDIVCDMEDVKGQTLAIVDDTLTLIIYSPIQLSPVEETTEYISAREYACLHGKPHSLIRRLCMEGRIPGVQKNSSGWLIPKNVPYPSRKKREIKQKTT